MVESLLKFVTEENLFSHEDKLLLAVSGGVDSMVMSQLFLNAGIEFSIAHVNYNLRGAQSTGDRDFVAAWAKEKGIEIHVREVEQAEYVSKDSIQMKAREIRYDFFNQLCEEFGFTKLATAHHIDDSFETVLLNLVKGTGPKGMRGIPVRNGYIIRPMMFAYRQQILDYAKAYGVKWREDPSNSKTEYQRNIVRHKVTDVLKEINPSLQDTFKDTLVRMNGAADLLEATKKAILEEHLQAGKSSLLLKTTWLSPGDQNLLLLSEIMSDYGLNFRQSRDMMRCILEKEVGKLFETPRFSLNVDRDSIVIVERKSLRIESIIINENDYNTQIGDTTIHFEVLSKPGFGLEQHIAYLDLDKVTWPMEVRQWREGDRFVPIGMKGKKMVSDFMIDTKIPVSLKGDVLVLISGGEIAWVMGHRISEKFKISNKTKRTLKISLGHA
ncbi:MAG: tRNA lysidine(34) synthetase TilS [Cyclobacteriaceae bacterium]